MRNFKNGGALYLPGLFFICRLVTKGELKEKQHD